MGEGTAAFVAATAASLESELSTLPSAGVPELTLSIMREPRAASVTGSFHEHEVCH